MAEALLMLQVGQHAIDQEKQALAPDPARETILRKLALSRPSGPIDPGADLRHTSELQALAEGAGIGD
jgi:hypothetical protein